MVRREEQPWQSRATLFLDNRVLAHRGQGIASSLEAAVSAAASIAVHLTHRGFAVRLVTATGEEPGSAWHVRDADAQHRPPARGAGGRRSRSPQPRLDTSWLGRGRARRPHGRRLRAVEATDLPVLRRMQHHAGSALAVALDVDAWIGATAGAARPGCSASRAGAPPRCGPATASTPSGRSSPTRSTQSSRTAVDGGHGMNRSRAASPPTCSSPSSPPAPPWLAMYAWRDLTVDAGQLPQPAAPARAGRRRHRHGRAVVAVAGAAVVLFQVAHHGGARLPLPDRLPLPIGGAWAELTDAITDAVDSARGSPRRCRPRHRRSTRS